MLLSTPAPSFGSLANQAHPLNRGLVAWYTSWGGVGGSGKTWRDQVGRAPLTHVGGATLGGNLGASWLPGAIRYSGTTPYSDAGQGIGSYGTNITVSLWARHENASNSGLAEALFHQFSGSNEAGLWHYSNNNLYAGFNSSGQDNRVVVAASASNWPQKVWTHYTLTAISAGATVLYVNGLSIGSFSPTTIVNPAANLRFGFYYFTTTYYSGSMSDIRIHNRALSASEVQQQYRLSLGLLSPLVAQAPRSLWVAPSVGGGITGAGAVTLGAMTSASTGTLALTATGAVTLGAMTSTATGTLDLAATGAVTLGSLTSAGTGTLALSATGTVTLGAMTSTGTGTLASGISGQGSVTLGAMTSAGTGTLDLTATGATALGALTSAGTGAVALAATGAVTLGAMTSTGAGTLGTPILATGAVTFGAMTSAGAGTLAISATGATTFTPMTSVGAAGLAIAAAGAATFGSLVSTGQGALLITATGAVTFAALTGAGSGSAGGLALVDSRTYVVPTSGAVREVTITASGDWVIV